MDFKKIKFGELSPAEYNPRLISEDEFKRLCYNLKEFGLVDPIIINLKNNRIIGGHQRYLALSESISQDMDMNVLCLGDIGWVFEDKDLLIKDERYEKSLNISLNRLSGEWDLDKLSKLLEDIVDSGLDNRLSGFQPSDFELYGEQEEISFNEDLFDLDKVYAPPHMTVCPHCNHEFFEAN